MPLNKEEKQTAIDVRDYVNERVNPVLRGKDANIKTGQDKLNYYFNGAIYGFIWIIICKETRKVANQYCPNVVKKRFIKGEEPTEICKLHEKWGPEIYKLPDELTVHAMVKRFGYPIIIAPVFIPSAGIEINLDEELFMDRQLNRIVKTTSGNGDRFFGFGGWEVPTLKRIHRPYLLDAPGIFDLFKINPDWIDTLDRRIGQRAERQISSVVTLIDNCSTHTGRPGFWNAHPWNGNNNINGTAIWKPGIYHFYEKKHWNVPGIKLTGEFIEAYIRFLVRRLDKKYRPYIMWEITNEGQAGHDYNKLIRGWLREEGVADDWRVITSLDRHYLDSYKKQMNTFLNYSIHGINTLDKYKEAKKLVQSGVRFLPSEDGEKPIMPCGFYKDMTRKMLMGGALGYESNERPYWYNNVFDPDLYNWHRIKMIGDGWKQFLEESGK